MGKIKFVHDIVEENGKTIKENNLEREHQIPVGTLVEVKYDQWHGDGACQKVHARLWVVKHGRDCDGTPLYTLSQWRTWREARRYRDAEGGFPEHMLTPVELTREVCRGENALVWDEDER